MLKKSEVLLGKRCCKAIWLKKNKYAVYQEQPNEKMEEILAIKELARGLIPQGKVIEYASVEEMEGETAFLMAQHQVLYGGTFSTQDIAIKCDMMQYGNQGWNVYVVKTSTKVKPEHKDEAALQYWVLDQLQYPIEGVYVVYLNSDYRRQGDLDLDELFEMTNVIEDVKASQQDVTTYINEVKAVLGSQDEPNIGIDKQCLGDIECPCKAYCWACIPKPSLFDISGSHLRKDKKIKLFKEGIVSFEQLEKVKGISNNVKMQVRSELYDEEIIDKTYIRELLGGWSYPLYFLDFESFMPAVPLYEQTKPYQQIPFQYSLHIVKEADEEIVHKEFLAEVGTEPLRAFAESLVDVMNTEGDVVVYNKAFEMTRIKELAERFPDLSDRLLAINTRIKDLMEPFKNRQYYNKAMHGDYSIKYVLPALFPDEPELDYTKLEIRNGGMAMNAYATLHLKSIEEQERTKQALLKYCQLDTLAMVKIWEKLKAI